MAARKILMIDDDRLQFRVTQGQFRNFRAETFELEWAATYDDGLARLLSGQFQACLLDYQLGPRDGLELIREAVGRGCRTPIIFLTAESSENVDIQAMNAGALDYLVKGEISVRALERSLRYALKLGETLDQLHRLATRDQLTGLLNRREFERVLAEEVERSTRFGHPFALVLLDLDHFKTVNDTHGHQAGDLVLQTVAVRITGLLRNVDRLARFGGEEMVAVLVEVDEKSAMDVAHRIVRAVADEPVHLEDGTALAVTISGGVAVMPCGAADGPALIKQADLALYAAKRAGRNRAVLAGAPE